MDERFEKVERLRRETGVSYEEARAAFETAGRDLLDALIALEKQGKAGRRRQRAGPPREPPVAEEAPKGSA